VTRNMSVEGPVTGTLPSVPHYFSTLIFHQEGGVERYYEVNYKFHGDKNYKSSGFFVQTWHYLVRPTRSAEKAIRYRVERVLARAGVKKITRFKYVASVQFPAKGTGKLRAMRHIARVVLSDDDFKFLYAKGYLRLLHVEEEGCSLSDKYRNVIFGLSPLQNRIAA
jgi:hypothetical protein